MDNQQERPVSLDFLAGLITGEGSFCLAVQRIAKRKGELRITPIFCLFMSDRDTIFASAAALRAYDLPVYIQERPKAGAGQVGIHASGMKRVKRYCETFIPLMSGQKLRAATLVLEFIDSRMSVPPGGRGAAKPYTQRELDIVRELRQVNGNTRGKKTPLESSEAIRRTPATVG